MQRNPRAVKANQKDEQQVIIATKTDRFGNEVPIYKKQLEADDRHQGVKQKKQKVFLSLTTFSKNFFLLLELFLG